MTTWNECVIIITVKEIQKLSTYSGGLDMKRYFVIGHRLQKQTNDACLCIMEAANADQAMKKAIAHYGTLRYTLSRCIECGTDEARTWFNTDGAKETTARRA